MDAPPAGCFITRRPRRVVAVALHARQARQLMFGIEGQRRAVLVDHVALRVVDKVVDGRRALRDAGQLIGGVVVVAFRAVEVGGGGAGPA